jgi:hypothetical protein
VAVREKIAPATPAFGAQRHQSWKFAEAQRHVRRGIALSGEPCVIRFSRLAKIIRGTRCATKRMARKTH